MSGLATASSRRAMAKIAAACTAVRPQKVV